MIMDLDAFRTKIEAKEIVHIGRYSCRLIDSDYCFFAETAEVYDSLENLWCRAKPFLTREVRDKREQI